MKHETIAEIIKTLAIIFMATVWALMLVKHSEIENEKKLKMYKIQNQHLNNELDSLQDLIGLWEKHHARIAKYAKEWDKTHTR